VEKSWSDTTNEIGGNRKGGWPYQKQKWGQKVKKKDGEKRRGFK